MSAITEDSASVFVVVETGRTTCCDAYSSIFIDGQQEYCKGCFTDVVGYVYQSEIAR